jgi:hypothetical protein
MGPFDELARHSLKIFRLRILAALVEDLLPGPTAR